MGLFLRSPTMSFVPSLWERPKPAHWNFLRLSSPLLSSPLQIDTISMDIPALFPSALRLQNHQIIAIYFDSMATYASWYAAAAFGIGHSAPWWSRRWLPSLRIDVISTNEVLWNDDVHRIVLVALSKEVGKFSVHLMQRCLCCISRSISKSRTCGCVCKVE